MLPNDSLGHRMDRLGAARAARALGLPEPLAERVAQVVVESGLAEDRRGEVFRELVAHFEDGLAAGRTPDELLVSFGDGGRTARMVRREKRIVTPTAMGGTGRGDGWLRRLARDARHAARRLVARPAFTITAVLSLAIGIGANSAMFTLVNEVIFRRPPLKAPNELVQLFMAQPDFPFNAFAYPDLQDLARGTREVFAEVGGTKLVLAGRESGAETERLMGELVTPNYFGLLGIRATVGRLIAPSDAPAPGTGAVVALSEGYWRRAFAGDPAVVGRAIRLSGRDYTVIGVVSGDYPGTMRGIATAFYAPITMLGSFEPGRTDPLSDRGLHGIFAQARLLPGVSLERARVAANQVATDFKERRVGGWHGADAITLVPAADVILYPPIDRVLQPVAWLVMVVVGLVLVIACANLAGFLLARAVDRRKEIAVRLSLGATRGQIVAQLLVETVLLSLAGGALGVTLGRAALKAVLAADLPLPMPITFDLPLDGTVLAFSILVSVAAGVFFGLAPALQSTRLDLASVIRLESVAGGKNRHRLRSALVGGQVAVAVVLLVGAGLFVRSLGAIHAVDPGFGARPTAVLLVGVPPQAGAGGVLRTVDRIEAEIARIPGVDRVGASSNLHLGMYSVNITDVVVDGVAPPPGRDVHVIDRASVDTGFIATVGVRLVHGWEFSATDDSTATPVVIVNEAFVAKFFPGRDPIGQHFRQRDGRAVEVVGVVNTVKIRTIAEDPRPFIYFPLAQSPPDEIWLVARTTGAAEEALGPMVEAIRRVDPDVFVMQRRTLKRQFEAQTLPLELAAGLLGAFAVLALVLASIGLYGTVSYSVAQRTREVGIRLSLGADRTSVVRLLLWGGLRVVLVGAASGIAASLVLARLLQGLLFGVQALDPATFLVVPLALVAVALVAAYLPARRAGRIDPILALRSE